MSSARHTWHWCQQRRATGVARSLLASGTLALFALMHTVPAPRRSRWTAFARNAGGRQYSNRWSWSLGYQFRDWTLRTTKLARVQDPMQAKERTPLRAAPAAKRMRLRTASVRRRGARATARRSRRVVLHGFGVRAGLWEPQSWPGFRIRCKQKSELLFGQLRQPRGCG